jgi:hypothetical protein
MKFLVACSALLFATSAFAAGAPSLSGQWKVHSSIVGHETDQDCKFVQDDNKITGSCKSADAEVPITGSLDGKNVTWKYQSDYNGTAITLTYSATLDDTGNIAGSVEVEPFGVTGDFNATPEKPQDAPAK